MRKKIVLNLDGRQYYFTLILIISLLFVGGTQSISAKTTYMFDWDIQNYPDSALQVDFANVADSEVDVNINVSGDTDQITTLIDNPDYSGDQTGIQDSFVNGIDLSENTQSVTVTVSFSKPVTNLEFVVHDIDHQYLEIWIFQLYTFIDQLQISGLSVDGSVVYPEFRDVGTCVAIQDNVVSGTVDDPLCQEANNNGTNHGDVRVYFPQEITQFSYEFNSVIDSGFFVLFNSYPQVIAISDFTFDALWDYGDLPECYCTTGVDACRHVTGDHLLFLGASAPDDEFGGHPTLSADGDNSTGVDEEAFSTLPEINATMTEYVLDVPLVNNSGSDATLIGWIDFNNDGVFTSLESVSTTVADGDSITRLTWTGFALLVPDSTYLRLRLTSDSSGIDMDTSAGSAPDGEVEDYLLEVGSATPVTLLSFDASSGKNQRASFSWIFILLLATLLLPYYDCIKYKIQQLQLINKK